MPRHPGHKKHLCKMVIGDMKNTIKRRSLVNNPKYVCAVCGNVANKSENLYAPSSLWKILPQERSPINFHLSWIRYSIGKTCHFLLSS